MNTAPASGFKNKRSKWLFVVILLLSFFTFSGSVLKPPARLDVQRITIVANPQTGFVRSISYKRALRQVYNDNSTRFFFATSTFDINRLHCHQVRTRINCLLTSYRCRAKITFYPPLKTFPPNKSDYPAPLG